MSAPEELRDALTRLNTGETIKVVTSRVPRGYDIVIYDIPVGRHGDLYRVMGVREGYSFYIQNSVWGVPRQLTDAVKAYARAVHGLTFNLQPVSDWREIAEEIRAFLEARYRALLKEARALLRKKEVGNEEIRRILQQVKDLDRRVFNYETWMEVRSVRERILSILDELLTEKEGLDG